MTRGRIRPRLLAVWLVLAGLVGVIVVTEYRDLLGRTSRRDSRLDPRMLLPVPVDELGAIEVAHGGKGHRFERDAAGAWFYHAHGVNVADPHTHQADPAIAERIGSAFAAFGRTRTERQFPLSTNGTDYGVTRPQTIIIVYRPGDGLPLAQYAVGDLAPDKLSRYVLPVGSSVVSTIPNYQIENLLTLIDTVAGQPDPGQATKRSP